MDYAKNGQTSILAKITPRHFFRNPPVQIKDIDQKNKFLWLWRENRPSTNILRIFSAALPPTWVLEVFSQRMGVPSKSNTCCFPGVPHECRVQYPKSLQTLKVTFVSSKPTSKHDFSIEIQNFTLLLIFSSTCHFQRIF